MNKTFMSPETYQLWFDGWRDVVEEDVDRVSKLLLNGPLSTPHGGILAHFEKRYAKFCGVAHAVASTNGTSSIHSALWAVGVRAGDDVLVCDYGFHGMAAAVVSLGARVVPVDCLPDSFSMDPADVPRKRTQRTRAILVLSPWGVPARFDEIRDAAPDLPLVSDASHAHGATYRGRPIATWADVTCYSLGLSKLITGGQLGCAVTDRVDYRDRMVILGHTNRPPLDLRASDWTGNAVGLKFRPHAVALTLAHGQVKRYPEKRAASIETCRRIEAVCREAGLLPQATPGGSERVYYKLLFRIDETVFGGVPTAQIEDAMSSRGVPILTNPYWPLLQDQDIFRWPDHAGAVSRAPCPTAQRVTPRTIMMPAPVVLPEQATASFAEGVRGAAEELTARPVNA